MNRNDALVGIIWCFIIAGFVALMVMMSGCAGVRTQEALDRAEFCESECCCSHDKTKEERRVRVTKPAVAER